MALFRLIIWQNDPEVLEAVRQFRERPMKMGDEKQIAAKLLLEEKGIELESQDFWWFHHEREKAGADSGIDLSGDLQPDDGDQLPDGRRGTLLPSRPSGGQGTV